MQILSEAFAPGVCIAELGRCHDISLALIYRWGSKLLYAGNAREADLLESLPTPVFVEAPIEMGTASANAMEHPGMINNLPRGKRLRIFAAASPALGTATLRGLR